MSKGIKTFKYLILIFIICFWNAETFAYKVCLTDGGKDIKWKNPETTYFINTAGGPSGTISAVEAGMQTWTDVATSNFIFYYGGTISSSAHGTNDGINIATFGSLPEGTVAENRYWYFTSNGRLLDSDIRFNTYYSWSTTGTPGTYDLQNVGTHEHGHSLCLKDLYSGSDSDKTMYGYVSKNETKKRTLQQDDIDGISFLYECPNFPVRILDKPYEYSSLQDAYDDSTSGDIILSQATTLAEDLFFDADKSVVLEGGYDCEYSYVVGSTTLKGDMIISNGSASPEDFVLE